MKDEHEDSPAHGFLQNGRSTLRKHAIHVRNVYVAMHLKLMTTLLRQQQAAKSKNELVAYYKKARNTMSKAARDVRASAAIIARKDRLVARKEEMMAEKRRLHAMGRVSVEEARAFIDKYRWANMQCKDHARLRYVDKTCPNGHPIPYSVLLCFGHPALVP